MAGHVSIVYFRWFLWRHSALLRKVSHLFGHRAKPFSLTYTDAVKERERGRREGGREKGREGGRREREREGERGREREREGGRESGSHLIDWPPIYVYNIYISTETLRRPHLTDTVACNQPPYIAAIVNTIIMLIMDWWG